MNREDAELLGQYAANRSEAAFTELVRRYVDLVYSAALRQLSGDAHLAEDVTQEVFADLARKARRLGRGTPLIGWLYTSTRYAASQVRRTQTRRALREQESHAMNQLLECSGNGPSWSELRPVLDDAIHDLSPADRTALLLRFFEHRSLKDVGQRLGITENTARMRIDRALGKLRTRLAARGIVSTAAALGTAIAQNAVSPAPPALASRVLNSAASVEVTSAPWFGTAGWTARLALASLAVLAIVSFALLPQPKKAKPGATEVGAHRENGIEIAQLTAGGSNLRVARVAQPSETFSGPELIFVDASTGMPVSSQAISLRGWERGSITLVEKSVPLEDGKCRAPFDVAFGPAYWVLCHLDGYADARLRWDSRKGDTIPELYTVRLIPPVPIGGRVVDPEGNPVVGAEVCFGNSEVIEEVGKTEDHSVEHVTSITDAAGRWEIDCIAPEVLPYLFGAAACPDFVESRVEVNHRAELVRQLRDRDFVFHLRQGVMITGTVADSSGRPIPDAHVRVGLLGESGNRDSVTGADGSFRIEGCKPGSAHVTASLEGYAPTAVTAKLEPGMSGLHLRLDRGRTLRLRIVDKQGLPIAGAAGGLDTLAGLNGSLAVPQVEFSRNADPDGRIVWNDAPNQTLQFNFSAPGYMEAPHVEVAPSDQEQRITLDPALVLSATVRDADSGELLPKFRLGIGWPDQLPDGSIQPLWTGFDRFWPTFTGGRFFHTVAEPVIVGTSNRGYIFRFEAPGYRPFVTRVYSATEGDVPMDIRLHKSEETAVSVYTPGGEPAAGVDVGLLAPGNRLTLGAGGFTTDFGETSGWVRRTDNSGCFLLPDDRTVESVAVAGPEGYAEATVKQLRKTPSIRLEPWARIEGQWRVGGRPVSHGRLSLELIPKPGRVLKLGASDFEISTDADGRFTFPKAPPGLLEISSWRGANSPGTSFRQREVVFQAHPGESNQVLLAQ